MSMERSKSGIVKDLSECQRQWPDRSVFIRGREIDTEGFRVHLFHRIHFGYCKNTPGWPPDLLIILKKLRERTIITLGPAITPFTHAIRLSCKIMHSGLPYSFFFYYF